jgi:hypothetical protein
MPCLHTVTPSEIPARTQQRMAQRIRLRTGAGHGCEVIPTFNVSARHRECSFTIVFVSDASKDGSDLSVVDWRRVVGAIIQVFVVVELDGVQR